MTRWRKVLPANSCRTFGLDERMRVPSPAARMIAADSAISVRLQFSADCRIAARPRIAAEPGAKVPPPGLEPRQRVPKTRVLPLHHGGMAVNPPSFYYAIPRDFVKSKLMRTGSPARGARGTCRRAPRRNRPRTPRGWRWRAEARSTARSGRPSASLRESAPCR